VRVRETEKGKIKERDRWAKRCKCVHERNEQERRTMVKDEGSRREERR
jgi:hypothetical protein